MLMLLLYETIGNIADDNFVCMRRFTHLHDFLCSNYNIYPHKGNCELHVCFVWCMFLDVVHFACIHSLLHMLRILRICAYMRTRERERERESISQGAPKYTYMYERI